LHCASNSGTASSSSQGFAQQTFTHFVTSSKRGTELTHSFLGIQFTFATIC